MEGETSTDTLNARGREDVGDREGMVEDGKLVF